MRTTWDELMRFAPEKEYALAPLQEGQAERIMKKTMQKLNTTDAARRPQRTARRVLLAAGIAALLCVSALAAYSLGWFDRLFGKSAALIKGSIAAYDETEQMDITYPTYTEAKQAMIAEGTMQVPEQAELAETGVSAQTDDFVFTLESMLASKDSLYAIMRIEAKTDDAAKELAALPDASEAEKERAGSLFVSASNNSGEGRQREWKNGGMSMDIIEADGGTAYVLLTNNGGEFEPGDMILFHMRCRGANVNLFEMPVPEQMQTELIIPLDTSVYEGKNYSWDTATITPISFRLDGTCRASMERDETEVSLTLNDGTSFTLSSAANGYASAPYGVYGSLSFAGTSSAEGDARKTNWLFSRMVDLHELASMTVDGKTYDLQDDLK